MNSNENLRGASSNSPSTIYTPPLKKALPTIKKIIDIDSSEVPENYAKFLWQGIDSVQECYNVQLHDIVVQELEHLKEFAKKQGCNDNGAVSFIFGGAEFQILSFAPKGSIYQVRDDDMIFLIGNTSKEWAISVRYLSAGLAEHGIEALKRKVISILRKVGRFRSSDYERLSRVDVCVDFKSKKITNDLRPSLLEGIVAPAKTKTKIFDNLQVFIRKGLLETLTIGTKGSLEISVYDKSKEIIESSKKTWFYKIWNLEEKEAKKDVWRIEVRFWRNYLRNRNIKTFDDFKKYKTELVNEAMYSRRLTVVNPADSNRSRWQYHPIWVIAKKYLVKNIENILTIGRQVTGYSHVLEEQLIKQSAGTLRSINILMNGGQYKEDTNLAIIGMIYRQIIRDKKHNEKVDATIERYKYVSEAC